MGHFHWLAGGSSIRGSHGFHVNIFLDRANSHSAYTDTEEQHRGTLVIHQQLFMGEEIISRYIHHLQKVLISATRLENDFFNLTTVNLLLQLLNVRLLRRESVRVLAASAAMGQLDNQLKCQQRHWNC